MTYHIFKKMEKYFGPKFKYTSSFRNLVSECAMAVLDKNDKEQIKQLGKRYLKLAVAQELSESTMNNFVHQIIIYEHSNN